MPIDPTDPPELPLVFTKRQLVQSVGQFLVVFLTGIAAGATHLKDFTWDAVYIASIQAAMAALLILGFSRVGPK